MAVYKYPQEVHDLVREWSPKLRDKELAAKCNAELGTNFTPDSIKSFRGNHGYRNGQKQLTHVEYWKYQTKWPQGMFEFIRDNSWGVSSAEMAKMVNEKFGTDFTQNRMKNFRQRNGIKSGCTGWYQKGRDPGNKGKKQSEYCSPEAIEASRRTQFKKGHKPMNELPVGTVRMGKHGYMIRKKQMQGEQWERWEHLHRAVWEEHNGPIPKGMLVMFKDGDKTNCSIDNLMLAKRTELAVLCRKGLVSEDPDLTETALHMVRLMQAANKVRRETS